MAHDEVNHVIPSYDLYMGRGYTHDPMTHGPMQFHLLALSYFLLGDTDFASRVPAALFSIATIIFVLFAFRRYLGRTGALLSALFFLISPLMLFYGRYTRNEAFIELFGVMLLYAVLHYLEKGKHSTLYLYAIVLSLYFCTKETSFIFTAEMLILLAVFFLKDVTQAAWTQKKNLQRFILLIMVALLLIGTALGAGVIDSRNNPPTAEIDGSGANTSSAALTSSSPLQIVLLICLALAAVSLIMALVLLLIDLKWKNIKNYRSFDLLLLTFTLVLPQLVAFPIKLLGWDPLDYSQSGLVHTSLVTLAALIIATALGLLWKRGLWVSCMAIFYAIFILFYTTFFTNGQGFFTGIVGSLGYWLSQQAFQRGTQPWYYYTLIQIPMYEYLAAAGTLLALVLGFRHKLFASIPNIAPALQKRIAVENISTQSGALPTENDSPHLDEIPQRVPVLALLLYWSVMSLVAFTIAGEKMPWLTVHIALPMLLVSGFSLGYMIDTLPAISQKVKSLLAFLLIPIFLISLVKGMEMMRAADKPFAGMDLPQLQITLTFLFSITAVVLSGWGMIKFLAGWKIGNLIKMLTVLLFGVLVVLTARSAYQANYINDDTAQEFFVYAHAPSGPKEVMAQIEDLSQRTTGGKAMKIVYIGSAQYPFWWYLRDYPNKAMFNDKLTRDLLQYPVIVSDHIQIDKVRAILDDNYSEFRYKRLVWPMEDYNHQTLANMWTAIKDSTMREALFDIWLNKDYTLYAQLKGKTNLTPETWEPSEDIYLFIKKDMVKSIWTFGTLPGSAEPAAVNPYAAGMVTLSPDLMIGESDTLNGPHGIAIAGNGSIYVTDAKNNRILCYSAEGKLLNTWGTYAALDQGDAPGGTFNEPWGIAVAPDGSVYVADTWNHRIQKFTADGEFITMWGSPGLSDSETAFWGPRGIAVNQSGQVFITDTGNNRVVIYDSEGNFLSQFGTSGIGAGEFSEPVGLAFDNSGNLLVADTWNQRIQVFQPAEDSLTYQPIVEWQVEGWTGQSINNKPFIAVDSAGHVFVTDPDAFRVLEFDSTGSFIRGWGGYSSSSMEGFGLPIGIAADSTGRIFVSDAVNNSILRFTLPE